MMSVRSRSFVIFNALFVVVFFGSLRDLIVTTWNSEYLTYIPFIPAITAYLLYSDKEKIFKDIESGWIPGAVLIGTAAALRIGLQVYTSAVVQPTFMTVSIIAAILTWIGGFIVCFGIQASKAALFPLLFLFYAVPLPQETLNVIISFLQRGSAEVSYMLITLGGVPVARDGFVFHLPNLNIEVAPQCSGIRSALSLLVTGSIAGYFFLKKGWTRIALIVSLLPVTIMKNGFRITFLTLFGYYIDPRILDSDLHKQGGYPFFIVALLMVWGEIVILRRLEQQSSESKIKGD